MKRLLQIEKIKALSYPAFRTLMIIHFVLFLLVILVASRIEISFPGFTMSKLYEFPYVWDFFPWIASWFNIFLGIVMILLVGNEFSYRTYRQNYMNGLSRRELVNGKLLLILVVAVYTLLLVTISGLIAGLINTGEDVSGKLLQNMDILGVYFVQALAYLSLGMLFAVIFRNNALSIILFILYFFPIEPILRAFFPVQVRAFFPIKIISNLTPTPEFLTLTSESTYMNANGTSQLDFSQIGLLPEKLSMGTTVLVAVAYLCVFVLASHLIMQRRNL